MTVVQRDRAKSSCNVNAIHVGFTDIPRYVFLVRYTQRTYSDLVSNSVIIIISAIVCFYVINYRRYSVIF